MTSLIIKLFVKNSENVNDIKVRTSYGRTSGIVCIICNVLLFAGKLIAGLLTASIAIMADAVNNISDASGNIVSLIGFKLAAKAPDEKHPYGHARYEYFAGLVVSVMVTSIGFSLGKESVEKIIEPEETVFSVISAAILIASILIKLWMCLFNNKIGKKIDSAALLAAAADSRNDVITTSAVLISMVISHFTGIKRIDGVMGLLVALFIVYSGINLVRDTLSPLLGEKPDPSLVSKIEKEVMSYPGVLGMHDLMIHDYGPGHQFASLHLELPAENDPLESHDLIDNIEESFFRNYGIHTSIHFDPIVTSDGRVNELRTYISKEVARIDGDLTIHDLRLVPGNTHTNVLFDLVFPAGFKGDTDAITESVKKVVISIDPKYIPKIKKEQSFV